LSFATRRLYPGQIRLPQILDQIDEHPPLGKTR
jgi:hypothetical protein